LNFIFFPTCLGNENLILHGIIRNEVIPWGVEVHIFVCTNIGTYCTKLEPYLLEPYLNCAKNSQMLIGPQNIMYKGKCLYIHRNNKNHILENQNYKHIHCFLVHLNKKKLKKYRKHTNPNPKGWSSFFSRNTSKLPFLAQEGQMKKKN
jgi:hypothetical protein